MSGGRFSSELPEILGGYRILERISEGGMGEVLLARKEGARGFEKTVAIKVLHRQHVVREDLKELFFNEARLAAQLSHPNVCQVFDYGEEADHYFIVMEHVRGLSVREIMYEHARRSALLPPALAGRIAADAARGLHHAHSLRDVNGASLGVVHRDVSPRNIVVTDDGCTKVLDFGIAKSRVRATATQVGMVRGTPSYMSPEQTQHADLDARSDIFSLGSVLYELLVGTNPFRRENMLETMKAVASASIVDPRDLRPELSQPFVRVVMCALERDLERRFQSADVFARAVEQAINQEGPPATSEMLAEYLAAIRPAPRCGQLDPKDTGRRDGAETVTVPGISAGEGTETMDGTAPDQITPLPGARRLGLPVVVALIGAVVVGGWLLLRGGTGEEGEPAGEAAMPLVETPGSDAGRTDAAAPGDILQASSRPSRVREEVGASMPRHRGRRPSKVRDSGGRRSPQPKGGEERSPAPVTTATGTLTVRADPYALVRIDGKLPLGPTPVRKHPLPVGEHRVELISPLSGEVRAVRRVKIVEGIDSRVVLIE